MKMLEHFSGNPARQAWGKPNQEKGRADAAPGQVNVR